MKTLLFLIFLAFHLSLGYSQGSGDYYASPTFIQNHFNKIKAIVQPDIIQLPDSVIVFPITGLTNIRNIPANSMSGPYTEIELWIIDAQEKIIYNNVIATQNCGYTELEKEYCHYMKLQSNYLLQQRHIAYAPFDQ